MEILRRVLRPPDPLVTDEVAAWWSHHRAQAETAPTPWEIAVVGGLFADRMAWAFAAGYEAAIAELLRNDRARAYRPAALCATEPGGAHPRAITTRWVDGALNGDKTFVTLGPFAEELLVLATTGHEPDGRSELVLLRVRRDAPGVALFPIDAVLPFVPEVPHASVRFTDVTDAARIEGDGWADFVRPFRTIEDVHVHTAVLAFWIAQGRRHGGPPDAAERGAAILASLRALAAADPARPSTHVALAGAIAQTRALLTDHAHAWDGAPAADRERWARDRRLLDVASKARAKRLEKAWADLAADATG